MHDVIFHYLLIQSSYKLPTQSIVLVEDILKPRRSLETSNKSSIF
jgi:hypothetical protein